MFFYLEFYDGVLDTLSHYIEVVQGDIFMEQKMQFGLVLGGLAVLIKTTWADYEQLLRAFFSCFQGQKMFIFFKNIFCFLNLFGSKLAKYSQSIVYCSTGDTSLRNFYIMTLDTTALQISFCPFLSINR